MSEDLPIIPDQDFRRSVRFPDLERFTDFDLEPSLERFDVVVGGREGMGDVRGARSVVIEPGKLGLLEIHRLLFHPREGAGQLRQSRVAAMFNGQDCPEPEFIDRALDNFERWLWADSFLEIHAIEQAALALTRLVDIWPFDFGNRISAVIFANFFLSRAGYPPFAVGPGQEEAFADALSAAIRMQTEPLVRSIYTSIIRELDFSNG